MTKLISEIKRMRTLSGLPPSKDLILEGGGLTKKIVLAPLKKWITKMVGEGVQIGTSKLFKVVGAMDPVHFKSLMKGQVNGVQKYVDLGALSKYADDGGQKIFMDDLTLVSHGMKEAMTEAAPLATFRIVNEAGGEMLEDLTTKIAADTMLQTTMRQSMKKGGVPTKIIDDFYGFVTKQGDEFVPSNFVTTILSKGGSRKIVKILLPKSGWKIWSWSIKEIPVTFRKVKLKPQITTIVAQTVKESTSNWGKVFKLLAPWGGGWLKNTAKIIGYFLIGETVYNFFNGIVNSGQSPLCTTDETNLMFQNELTEWQRYLDTPQTTKEIAQNIYDLIHAENWMGRTDQDPAKIKKEFGRIKNVLQAAYVAWYYRYHLSDNDTNTSLCNDLELLDVSGMIGWLIDKTEDVSGFDLDFDRAWVDDHIEGLQLLTKFNTNETDEEPGKIEEIAQGLRFGGYPKQLIPAVWYDATNGQLIIGGCDECNYNIVFDNATIAKEKGYLYTANQEDRVPWECKYGGFPMSTEDVNSLIASGLPNPFDSAENAKSFGAQVAQMNPAEFNEIVGENMYSIDYVGKTPEENPKATVASVKTEISKGLQSLKDFKNSLLNDKNPTNADTETKSESVEGLGSLLK
jgi:hypothetical protein